MKIDVMLGRVGQGKASRAAAPTLRGRVAAASRHETFAPQARPAMPIARRQFLVSMSAVPIAGGCAADLTRHADATPSALAAQSEICSATYAVLKAGRLQEVVPLSGCPAAAAFPAGAVYQAASLTKPVVA
jgi:CubicO group peptidase (beta-lactamase class C family)